MTKVPKTKTNPGMILSVILALIFFFSAFGKLAMPEMAENFSRWNLSEWMFYIAFGEILYTILFLIKKTSILGVLLLSSHLGGAIVTHLANDEMFLVPLVLLLLVWVAAFLRNPKLLQISME